MMLINLKRFWTKLGALAARSLRVIWWLPLRLLRLWRHIAQGVLGLVAQKRSKILHWWVDFAFLLMDLVGVPEVAESVFDFVKWKTRPLSPLEKTLAASVFGDTLPLDHIRMDTKAWIGCKNRNIVYVSYFTVNAWGNIRPATLIHELVHVWHYLQFGGAYIPKALRAQRSKAGYNYGGVEALRSSMEKNGKFTDFNLEQQADIFSDYYAIREGLRPVWGKGTLADLPVYEYFLWQIKTSGTA